MNHMDAEQIAEALGLKDQLVTKIIITVLPCTPVTAQVTKLVMEEDGQKMVEVFDHYKLVPEDSLEEAA